MLDKSRLILGINECSCTIECIKRVEEKRLNAQQASNFITFFEASLINSFIHEHGCLILFVICIYFAIFVLALNITVKISHIFQIHLL